MGYCLEFPCTLHHSWAHLLLASGLVPAKRRLVRGLGEGCGSENTSPDKSPRSALNKKPRWTSCLGRSCPQAPARPKRRLLGHSSVAMKRCSRMDNRTLFGTSEKEWAKILSNEGLVKPGLTRIEANIVARHVRFLLGTPA